MGSDKAVKMADTSGMKMVCTKGLISFCNRQTSNISSDSYYNYFTFSQTPLKYIFCQTYKKEILVYLEFCDNLVDERQVLSEDCWWGCVEEGLWGRW